MGYVEDQAAAAATTAALQAALAAANAVPVFGELVDIGYAIYEAIENLSAIVSGVEDVVNDIGKLFSGGASQPDCRDPSAHCQCLHHAYDWSWSAKQCDDCIRNNGYPPGSASGGPAGGVPISQPYNNQEADQLTLVSAIYGERVGKLWLAMLHTKGQKMSDALINFIHSKPEYQAIALLPPPAPAPLPPSLQPSPIRGMNMAQFNALSPLDRGTLLVKQKTDDDIAAAAGKTYTQAGTYVPGQTLSFTPAELAAMSGKPVWTAPAAPPGRVVIPIAGGTPNIGLGQAVGIIGAAPTNPIVGGFVGQTVGAADGGNPVAIGNAELLTMAQQLIIQAKYVRQWVGSDAADRLLTGAHYAVQLPPGH